MLLFAVFDDDEDAEIVVVSVLVLVEKVVEESVELLLLLLVREDVRGQDCGCLRCVSRDGRGLLLLLLRRCWCLLVEGRLPEPVDELLPELESC